MEQAPLLLIPCIEGRFEGAPPFANAPLPFEPADRTEPFRSQHDAMFFRGAQSLQPRPPSSPASSLVTQRIPSG